MGVAHHLSLILAVGCFVVISLLLAVYFYRRRRIGSKGDLDSRGVEGSRREDLVIFDGEEDLTIYDILDAPGEVIGKSAYGTVFKASLQRFGLRVLRFLRPGCGGSMEDLGSVIRVMGCIRHDNLVPLNAFYVGPMGEALLVHPFYPFGNLSQFVRERKEACNWDIIYNISLGITKGIDHLHTGVTPPFIHGNLKSKNILLNHRYKPTISDFGLHHLLNSTAAQEMLESSTVDGYRAPEHIKMKDASKEADIYSLGVIFLELITGKEPVIENASPVPRLHLPNTMRNAILNRRTTEFFRHEFLTTPRPGWNPVMEDHLLKYFSVAMDCCSPSPPLRPDIKQVIARLEAINL